MRIKMDIIEQIEKLREINKQHKLVIFVGAGVSRNSGVCSWWELVKRIAIEIGYNDICEKCELKYLTTTDGENSNVSCIFNNRPCQYEFSFSNEEFLKIPQYYYETDETAYLQLMKEIFDKPYKPNEIDELIVALEPEHIITTNYDHLIEDVKNPSISNYTVIKSNNDLLEKGRHGRKYIIKMHGDIDDLDNIVLKEDDYLTYSLNHELLEIYIKSILIDKTILFVGYSLGDNNLKLIMSYINYFANTLEKERPPHYLAVNKIDHEARETQYWLNKGVELVDLSKVSDFMKEKTRCDLKPAGKPLYSFLSYIKNDRLPYYKDGIMELRRSLLNSINSLEPFKRISSSTLLSICSFSRGAELQNGVLNILDSSDYDNLRSILIQNDGDSSKIKECFLKAGVKSIYNKPKFAEAVSYDLITDVEAKDELFNLSMNWDYSKIVELLSTTDNAFEKAYYYSLIYRTKDNKCLDILSNIESDVNQKDFKYLTLNDKYQIAILKFNLIAIRLLCFNSQRDQLDNLDRFIDSSSTESKAFEYIKKYINDNGKDINELNKLLLKHEEYYMRKSTMTKIGGTIYGDLFKLQAIVYDYYYFYKNNYLMLDWFNNISKMCEPYIKAILCTYYPDEYQFSNPALGRTYVKPYPLNLTDINLIIRHVKYKDFLSWLSYYKVFSLSLSDEFDITKIFDDFCISIRSFWHIVYEDYINVFGKILSLIELSKDKCQIILLSFVKLVTPDDKIGIAMLRTCLKALWLFVDKHYDADDPTYYQLLELLIDEQLLVDPLDMRDDHINLIHTLAPKADKKIYDKCCSIIDNCNSERKKAYYPYVFKDILLKFDKTRWTQWIVDNLEHNWTEEAFDFLKDKIIPYDEVVSKYFEEKLKNIKETTGVETFPDIKSELINSIVILHLLGIIPDLGDMTYLNHYCQENDYLDFLLNPETFDYSKINTADYMWCNFINSDKYRDTILIHKSDFWSIGNEKRIQLGFGSSFENMVAYKYLFK